MLLMHFFICLLYCICLISLIILYFGVLAPSSTAKIPKSVGLGRLHPLNTLHTKERATHTLLKTEVFFKFLSFPQFWYVFVQGFWKSWSFLLALSDAAGDIEAGDSILMVDLGRPGASHAPPASRSALGFFTWWVMVGWSRNLTWNL